MEKMTCACFNQILGFKAGYKPNQTQVHKFFHRLSTDMVNQQFDVMPIINAATQARDYLYHIIDKEILPSNVEPSFEHDCSHFKSLVKQLAELHANKKRPLERESSPPAKRLQVESPDQTDRVDTPWQDDMISDLTEGWGLEKIQYEGEEEDLDPSHDLEGFRKHLEKISNHWYRKQKDGTTKTTFLCHWRNFPHCKSEEDIDMAIRGRQAMRSYLLGKSTRARNTLLNRNPELANLLKTLS